MKIKENDKARKEFVEEIRVAWNKLQNATHYMAKTDLQKHYESLVDELKYYDKQFGYETDLSEWKN